jgi:HemY protein
MWRALLFIALLALAAFGAVWLADRPGNVLITWGGYRAETSVAVTVVMIVGAALLLSLLWSAVRFIMMLPGRMTFASRTRKRARGYQAVSRGMVAVGAGDPLAARRYAKEAERLLGGEPLTLLLKAQAAQVSGDRPAAEAAFARLMEDPETRVLGLRGLFVEARRRGDTDTAHEYAAEAARLAPAATWANEAVLEAQGAEGDWRGAIATVERRASLGLVEKQTARRQRAVLLAADAQARADRDPEGALTSALDAVKLSPDLVPAAAMAGSLLARRGDLRRAAKVVEAAWKLQPHPDLAAVYLNLRPGDSGQDRLRRAETLAKLSSWDPEARIALARAALDAREFPRARTALSPLLHERPTVRVCLLMADLEEAENGASGRTREWIARAARAPRDPAWIADGVVSDRWAPMSPVTGRIDAFVWQAPPDVLAAPEIPVDDVVADLDDGGTSPALAAPDSKSVPVVEHAAAEAISPGAPAAPAPPEAQATAAAVPVADEARQGPAAKGDDGTTPAVPTTAKPNGAHTHSGEPLEPVTFPVEHAPDDPGPDKDAEAKPSRFRLFG